MEIPYLTTPSSNIEDERPKEMPNETPSPSTIVSSVRESDYDTPSSISPLYKAIESKNWPSVISIAEANPEQAATWVSRKEKSGKLRWRLLPLHAAIIFKSPEKMIEHLLASYPLGAQSKDDQGMLPIHLAFRNGSSEGVVNLLLVSYPQSIHVKDRKGRIPLVLAQASSSPNKEAFLRSLERGPSYYAVAAAATERAAVTAEHQAIFEVKVQQMEQENQGKVRIVQNELEVLTKTYSDNITTLEQELESSKNMSNVLSDHISALEAQLESRGDAELMLAHKCKKLEEQTKTVQKERDTLDVNLNVEKRFNQELEEKVLLLEQDNESMTKMLEDKANTFHSIESTQQSEKGVLSKSNEQLKGQLSNAHTTIVAMDARLKKRLAVEDSLTKQLSEMARTTAEMSASKYVAESDRETSKSKDAKKIRLLNERVTDLQQQLVDASESLSSMVQEQEQVVLLAQNYEEKMTMSQAEHESIQNSVAAQVAQLEIIRMQRENIVSVLQTQMEQLDILESNHTSVSSALQTQEKDLQSVEYLRNMMLDCALKQKQDLSDKIVDIRDGIQQFEDKQNQNDMEQQSTVTGVYEDADADEDVRDGTPFDDNLFEPECDDEQRTEQEEEIITPANEELVSVVSPRNLKKMISLMDSEDDNNPNVDDEIEVNTVKAEIVAE